MRIAVTGGKGGTGKSTLATALAVELAKSGKVLLFDADADCPNDYTILSMKKKLVKMVNQMIPRFDEKKCTKCGRCGDVCRVNAILVPKGQHPSLIPEQCNGCGACLIACPTDAISRGSKEIGAVYEGSGAGTDLVMGELLQGQPLSEFVVSAAKEVVEGVEGGYDFVITDTAAGTHCDVISALMGNELAIAVTEPTPLGAHDLELILKLLKVLRIPAKVVLNKADVGDPSVVEGIAKKHGAEIIARIPYSRSVLESYSKGEPVREENIAGIAGWLRGLQGGGRG